jgi:uncharacterized cofD-like protein
MAGESGELLTSALEHRFVGSDIAGHALGNLLLVGLHAATADFVAAVDELSRLVGVDPALGRVLPATADPVVLQAELTSGRVVTGQVAIAGTPGIDRIVIDPPDAAVPPAVVDAVLDADQVVLGPGSLFTSVLAAAVVDDVRAALERSTGHRVYVCNLQAESGETCGYDVAAHVAALRRHDIEPDVVLAQRGALPLGAVDGVDVVEADVARADGRGHDPVLLGAALAELVV